MRRSIKESSWAIGAATVIYMMFSVMTPMFTLFWLIFWGLETQRLWVTLVASLFLGVVVLVVKTYRFSIGLHVRGNYDRELITGRSLYRYGEEEDET